MCFMLPLLVCMRMCMCGCVQLQYNYTFRRNERRETGKSSEIKLEYLDNKLIVFLFFVAFLGFLVGGFFSVRFVT